MIEYCCDFINIALAQTVLVAVLDEVTTCVDNKNAVPLVGVLFVDDDNAGSNARTEKQIRGQADDAFDETFINQ